MTIRITRKTARLLQALLDARKTYTITPNPHLMDRSGIRGTAFYQLMADLQNAGWVEEYWEPLGDGRPRRLFFRLTSSGAQQATDAVAKDAARYYIWDKIREGLKKWPTR